VDLCAGDETLEGTANVCVCEGRGVIACLTTVNNSLDGAL